MTTLVNVEAAVNIAPPSLPGEKAHGLRRIITNSAFIRILSILCVVGFWQLFGTKYFYVTSYPSAVVDAFGKIFLSQIAPAFKFTIETLGLGLAICVLGGIPIGLAMARSRLISLVLEPYAVMLFSIPFIALFPILILEFGISFNLRVTCVVLAGIFPVIINTARGARQVDPALLDVGKSLAIPNTRALWSIVLPGSARFIFAGIRIGFARGMIGAIVVELEASAVGIGSLLQRYVEQFLLADFFATLILLGLFAIVCTLLISRAEVWVLEPWNRRSSKRQSLRSTSLNVIRIEPQLGNEPTQSLASMVGQLVAPFARVSGFVSRIVSPILRRGWVGWIVRTGTVGAIFLLWDWRSKTVSRAVLPSANDIAKAAYNQVFTNHQLIGPMISSFEVLICGFLLSLALGLPLGILMGRSRIAERLIDPYVAFLYALPHVSFIPVMILWLGFGFKFMVAYVVVSAIFPVIVNTMSGVKGTDPDLIDTGKSFCASERKIRSSIVIPAAVPLMLTGARIAFSASWVGVVVAEILSTNTGLGGLITVFSDSFKTADMFVPIIAIMVIAYVLLEISTKVEQMLMPWALRDTGT